MKHPFFYLLLLSVPAVAQNYHAIQGSSYAGSLGIANNPASIVNTPYPWDLTLFSVQATSSTNFFTLEKYSLLSSPYKAKFNITNGNYSRYADVDFNIHLLNARFALNRKQAIGFGMNLRGYGRAKSSPYYYLDSLTNMNDFFGANEGNPPFSGHFSGSSWIEVFATYSQTIFDNEVGRLNGGLTVKVTRGISGAFAQLQDGISERISSDPLVYSLKSGSARYGYSSNYDGWHNSKTTMRNLKDFLKDTRGGLTADIGFEYLIKTQAVTNIYDDDPYYDYEWKIGLSLLDLGHNQYIYGSESRAVANPKGNITDDLLNQKFDSVKTFSDANDSLATIANTIVALNGKFRVHNPARLVLNVDKYLSGNFYVNGEISINLTPDKQQYTRDINLLTITPRWETRRWGIYIPVQYNTEGQFWIGGAFKAGPLLFGVHNWANIFSKNTVQNGGGYLALQIRPFQNTRTKRDKRLDCPVTRN
jgi:hypothetical protein